MKGATLSLLMTANAVLAQTTITFDAAGDFPEGWQSGVTGSGAAQWELVRDDSPASPRLS